MLNILELSDYGNMHIVVFIINILLFVFSKKIVYLLNNNKENERQLSFFRILNVLFFIFHFLDLALLFFRFNHENIFFNFALTFMYLYFGIMIYNLVTFFTRKKFGISKCIDDKVIYYDSYSSRMVNLLLIIIITMLVILLIIQQWQFNSLLETTGVFGLVIAFLALTNPIWAPDLYYGLVILSSNMLEDGDVITFGEQTDKLYIINKVTFVYTILLDVSNNHRILIRNARVVDATVNNLSKKASLKGLRYDLSYKIGYPSISNEPQKDYQNFKKKIDTMFSQVQEEAFKAPNIKVNDTVDFTWYLKKTGDHALEFVMSFHISSLPSTRSTKMIRSYLMATPNLINELVYKASLEKGINLSTPITLQNLQSV